MDARQRLAEILKQARDKTGLNQIDAARSLGISAAQLYRLENAKITSPRGSTLRKLSEGYEIPIEELWPPSAISPDPNDLLLERLGEVETAVTKELASLRKMVERGNSQTTAVRQLLDAVAETEPRWKAARAKVMAQEAEAGRRLKAQPRQRRRAG